jgi:pimeloyl-ACP methyl ester carboxylesterase
MPTRMRKVWAPSGPASRDIGPIRKSIPKCSTRSYRSPRPSSVTPSALHIPNVTTQTPGLTNTPTCRDPANREIQADLLYDYRTNVASYPAWQAWLLEHKPPTLVVWGRNDPSFIAPGAEAFKRDLPDAEIHLLDAGHFALDEKNDEIASLILAFLAKHSV